MSFFWGETPSLTPSGARRKRDMANAFVANIGSPRNVGEGLTAIGSALASRGLNRQAEKAEKAGRERSEALFRSLITGEPLPPRSSDTGPMTVNGIPPRTPEQEIGDDAMAAIGKPEAMSAPGYFDALEQQHGLPAGYLARTAQIESGGDPNAQNPNSSAGGMFQFIDSTAQQYGLTDKMDPRASADAAARLAADNAAHLRAALGREPTAAELYLAHQQGAGGAARLLANPDTPAASIVGNDAVTLNGGNTRMSARDFSNKWTGKFGGQAPVQQMPDNSRLYAALADPWLDQTQKSVIMGMIQQNQQAADPLRQMQLERAQIELDNLRNPQPGFSVLTDAQEAAMGLDPSGSYQRGADGKISQIGGRGTNITLKNEGTIPQGFRAVRDADGNLLSYEAVPGGPEDTSAEDALAANAKATSANIVLDEIGIAKELIAGESTLSPATGITGSIASTIDSTRAGALKNRLTTIKANIGFDKLQAMRDASPTGGALGQVSEFENRLLQSVFGSLEQAQSAEDIQYNLDRLEGLYNRVINEGIPDDEARDMYRQIELGGRNRSVDFNLMNADDINKMIQNGDHKSWDAATRRAAIARLKELR